MLVHGDTVTTFAAALASFFHEDPRGSRRGRPADERPVRPVSRGDGPEAGRVLSSLHFAPTEWARENLLTENVAPEPVYLTGNTVIDALFDVLPRGIALRSARLQEAVDSGRRLILMTTHRRENWGEPLRRVYQAILELLERHERRRDRLSRPPNPGRSRLADEMLGRP